MPAAAAAAVAVAVGSDLWRGKGGGEEKNVVAAVVQCC